MMLMTTVGATPRYSLLGDDNLPIGPSCLSVDGRPCSAIYGFSGRDAYDRFRGVCGDPWRPYPLVRRHLENVSLQPGLQLVVIDALSPNETALAAATAEAVLAAQVDAAQDCVVGYCLSRGLDDYSYTVEPAPQ